MCVFAFLSPLAPPPILRPEFRSMSQSDNVITLKLKGASGMHGTISHYLIVVITQDQALHTSSNNFNVDQVGGWQLGKVGKCSCSCGNLTTLY
jgi:hypothetical protein